MTVEQPLWVYWVLFAFAWLALTVVAWNLSFIGRRNRHPKLLPVVLLILLASVAVRVLIVFGTTPQLSDDIRRYIHDGWTFGVDGENPYAAPPAERVGRGAGINHPELVTIYQPTSQWVFAALAGTRHHLPGTIQRTFDASGDRTFRLGFVLFDFWIIALLLYKLIRDGRSPWWAVLYALHPLAVTEVAWSGHQDVIGIAWLLTTLTLLDIIGSITADNSRDLTGRGPRSVSPRLFTLPTRSKTAIALLAGGAFALAIGVKPLVAPLVLPIVWSLRRRPRLVLVWCVACVLTLVALYLPFALMPDGLDRMIETVHTFIDKWAFNGSAHSLLLAMLDDKQIADRVMAAALLAVLVGAVAVRCDLWRAAQVYLFAGLLLSSTAHPWYLLWALAFVPIRFDVGVWVLSLAISWSYAGRLGGDFALPLWLRLVEYLPVYALVAWGLWCGLVKWRQSNGSMPSG